MKVSHPLRTFFIHKMHRNPYVNTQIQGAAQPC